MREGFFTSGELVPNKAPAPMLPQCGACGLYKTCNSPKMEPSGKGKCRVLFVAEAPGEDEDEKGIQLVGQNGEHLRKVLARLDFNMREDGFLTNALICRPPDNRKPTVKEITYCRPNLTKTIQRLNPSVIVPLGEVAIKSLLGGGIWKEDVGSITRWAGFQIPCQKPNVWICPTYHPSYLLREKNAVLDLYFERHLRAAIQLKGKPWEKVPDFKSKVRCILDPDEAAYELYTMMEHARRPMAFDYETDRLKPDCVDAQIVSCSVSDGHQSIAFPYQGKKIWKALSKFLRSSIPKIGSNIKFEDRWTRAFFGFSVKAFIWDIMLAAHWLDCRSDITSAKFQGFVNYGVPDYDHHIKPFLEGEGGNGKNKIKQIPILNLLLYNGMDSLVEWFVAKKQMRSCGLWKTN